MIPVYDAMHTGTKFHVNPGESASFELELSKPVDTVTLGHFRVRPTSGNVASIETGRWIENGGYILLSIQEDRSRVTLYVRSPQDVLISDLTLFGDTFPALPAPEVRHADSKGRIALSLPEGPYKVTRIGKSFTVSPL